MSSDSGGGHAPALVHPAVRLAARDAAFSDSAPSAPTKQHPIRLERLTIDREEAWRDYVGRHPDATPFHELAWRRAVSRAFGHTPQDLLARRGSRVCGVLPLTLVRSRFGGRMLVSVPYGVYGGPLCDDGDVAQRLARAAESLAHDLSANSIDLRLGPSTSAFSMRETVSQRAENSDPAEPAAPGSAESDLAPRQSGGWHRVDDYVTFRRELPAAADDVAAWLPRKARAAARRAAERNDLSVSFDPGDWPIVWDLYSRSMRRLGSINYPAEFFRALLEESCGGCLVQVVRCDGVAVAALVSLIHRRTFMPYFVGADERCDAYGLNNYLYFHAMRRAVELGCTYFDFGRSRRDNAGSFEFKRLHGFDPAPLEYLRWTPVGAGRPALSPSNPRFRLARRAWPHLPLALTRPLGAWLSKSIPG